MSESVEKVIGGKKLVVNPAPYKDANRLSKAIGRALKGSDMSGLPDTLTEDMDKVQVGGVIQLVLSVATDDTVEDAAFECAKRSAYDGIKVGPELFDDHPEYREHYYPIMAEIIRVNVQPFFAGLFSAFSDLAPAAGEKSQKQK